MLTVAITVPVANLSEHLAAMRKWLAEHACDTRVFTQERYGNSMRVILEFEDDIEGRRFKEVFSQTQISRDDLILLEPKLNWAIDFNDPNTNRYMSTNTMARVCWCRLMAEEVRVVADECNSLSAKKTLQVAAETWDRLADTYERYLAGGQPTREGASAPSHETVKSPERRNPGGGGRGFVVGRF